MTSPDEPTSGKMQNNKPLPYNFKISSLLEEAWDRLHGFKTTYWGGILIFFLLGILIAAVLGGIARVISAQPFQTHISIASNVASFLLYPLYYGLFYIGVLRASDQLIRSKMVFLPFKRTLHIWGTIILLYFIILGIFFIGFLVSGLCVELGQQYNGFSWMPGVGFIIGIITSITSIYFCFSFIFAPMLVFEKKMGILQALRASFLGFSQHWFKIIILQISMAIIITMSAIPLFVGVIWTLPMGINLFGILYRTIFGVEQHSLRKDVL